MTAYAGLFILIPILNRAIVNLSGRELLKICLAIFVVFSLIPTLLNETVFGLGGGYSAIWLLLLYICGGFWGKYHEICLTHLPDFCFRHRRCDFVCLYAAPPPLLWRPGVPSASAPLLRTTPAADGPMGTRAPSA